MSHSHIPLKHFLKQIETHAATRGTRGVRPEWLTHFIEEVAELFDPMAGVGRVGFTCQATAEAWHVGLYLGRTEVVGGREDGQTRHMNFEFDVLRLWEQFTHVTEFAWSVVATPESSELESGHSLLRVKGVVKDGYPLSLEVYSVPPEDVGPGLRQTPGGELEPY